MPRVGVFQATNSTLVFEIVFAIFQSPGWRYILLDIWLLSSRKIQDMRWFCRKQWHFSFGVNISWGKSIYYYSCQKNWESLMCIFHNWKAFSHSCCLYFLVFSEDISKSTRQCVPSIHFLVTSLLGCMPILNCFTN